MTTVRDVMNPDLVIVRPEATVQQAAGGMFASHTGSTLVMEGDRLLGIFTERDIVKALSGTSDAGRSSIVRERMTPDPQIIGPEATIGEALDRMFDGGFRHLPVVDGGRVIGVVSMRDLAEAATRHHATR
ncbi:MAG TPA: CBS domain-containing protein [Actinomycetota bacterium]|jgi:CBS domain-containing protein